MIDVVIAASYDALTIDGLQQSCICQAVVAGISFHLATRSIILTRYNSAGPLINLVAGAGYLSALADQLVQYGACQTVIICKLEVVTLVDIIMASKDVGNL